jgi:integrase
MDLQPVAVVLQFVRPALAARGPLRNRRTARLDEGGRRILFKEAFALAGLPYFNPHSFRKTLALIGGQLCRSAEEYKAWSQNLGHEHILTTFCNYGDVSSYRQAEIIRAFCERGEQTQQAT